MPLVRDPGSFRDPSGFVCHLGDEVFRAIDAPCSSLVERLEASGLLRLLERSSALIPTRVVRHDEGVYQTLRRHHPEVDAFLQHEKVPFISYPYEWSAPMLADAAVCCLDLQLLLIEHGFSLKDASAYNVQFTQNGPVFIDVPSIETVRRRDLWTALDQFNRMFLFPLLLNRRHGVSPREYFLSNLDGADLDEVYRRFGFFGAMGRSCLLDVWIPYQLQRLMSRDGRQMRSSVEKDQPNARPLVLNLKRLTSKVRALGSASPNASRWLDYAGNNSYDDAESLRKETFVKTFLDEHPAKRVLDIGCNTGRFSELAARRKASVIAIDTDAACIDALYRRARDDRLDILPLVMDIASPSPGLGYMNTERASFLDRASFDCVFALALVHHLLVTARLGIDSIRDLFAALTSRYLIVEFVEPPDPMFVSLLGARENIYNHLSLGAFMAAFEHRFELISRVGVTEHRTLVAFEKR